MNESENGTSGWQWYQDSRRDCREGWAILVHFVDRKWLFRTNQLLYAMHDIQNSTNVCSIATSTSTILLRHSSPLFVYGSLAQSTGKSLQVLISPCSSKEGGSHFLWIWVRIVRVLDGVADIETVHRRRFSGKLRFGSVSPYTDYHRVTMQK